MKKRISQLLSRVAAKFETPAWQGPLMEQAIAALRKERVLTASQAGLIWHESSPPADRVVLRYHRETFLNCMAENKAREAMWVLVWLFGFSLRAQRARAGENRFRTPVFDSDPDCWWLDRSENPWVNRKFPGAYYLINFEGKFGGMPWKEQEENIHALGGVFRAREAMITEAAIGFRQARHFPLLANWYHWGPSRDSQKRRVYVGQFDNRGFWIQGEEEDPEKPDDRLRVCLVKSWEF